MNPVLIADFNSPLCHLAGLWADQRLADGAEVDWRAVEHVPQPELAAAEAGRVWGGYLPQRPAPFERVDAQAAVERLVSILSEIGFDPAAEPAARRAAAMGRGCGSGCATALSGKSPSATATWSARCT